MLDQNIVLFGVASPRVADSIGVTAVISRVEVHEQKNAQNLDIAVTGDTAIH